MKFDEMRELISTHPDFRDEQPEIVKFLRRSGFGCIFLPKFHCEINPIEKCWVQAKCYTRAHTNYMIQQLKITVPQGLDSITIDNIRNYFRKARNYMFAYLEGMLVARIWKIKLNGTRKSMFHIKEQVWLINLINIKFYCVIILFYTCDKDRIYQIL